MEHTEGGIIRSITAQACDVNKTFVSVSKIVQGGHQVVFDKDGNYMEDKVTREKLWMEEEHGMYAFKLWVKSNGKHESALF